MIKGCLSGLVVAVLALCVAEGKPLIPASRQPVRAEPVRPDAGCAAFGPGFRKIDGSDTCVKVGGAVRVEVGVTTGTR